MDSLNRAEQIIQKFKEDEMVMIRLFVQWCRNHRLDPRKIYRTAYPDQRMNKALQDAIEADDGIDEFEISNETMLDLLQLFGNDDLAFAVADEIARMPSSR